MIIVIILWIVAQTWCVFQGLKIIPGRLHAACLEWFRLYPQDNRDYLMAVHLLLRNLYSVLDHVPGGFVAPDGFPDAGGVEHHQVGVATFRQDVPLDV